MSNPHGFIPVMGNPTPKQEGPSSSPPPQSPPPPPPQANTSKVISQRRIDQLRALARPENGASENEIRLATDILTKYGIPLEAPVAPKPSQSSSPDNWRRPTYDDVNDTWWQNLRSTVQRRQSQFFTGEMPWTPEDLREQLAIEKPFTGTRGPSGYKISNGGGGFGGPFGAGGAF